MVFEVVGGRPLRGRVRVPGDKSISHRALLLAALARGTSRLSGLADGDDVARAASAVAALGAEVAWAPGPGGTTVVDGGRDRLRRPAGPIDLGNSGTGMRLLAGVCASLPWVTELAGDESLSRRPMDRVASPLAEMGAEVQGTGGRVLPPLRVRGGGLHGIDHTLAVASAQVKGAVLLAGLGAAGETVVREAVPTRAHTEELLARFGADVAVEGGGLVSRVRAGPLSPADLAVPGDPSQAAFWVVAACIVPGSDVVVEDVYLGPARTGFLDVLARMGAAVTVERHGDGRADVRARHGPLVATDVGGAEVPGLIDEIPVLAVAASAAEGVTTFSGAAELRVKESDRVATVVEGLRAVGAEAEERPDGLVVTGPHLAGGGHVRSHLDHRVAMALAVAALGGRPGAEPTRIAGWEAVVTSYPSFDQDLERLCR